MTQLCVYGCGNEGIYAPGKYSKGWCCSSSYRNCSGYKSKLKQGTKWNKGLTKSDDERIARPKQIGMRFGISLNGHTEETKKQISDKMKGNRNANHRGDRQSYHNDIRMDSKWEVGVAQYLDKMNIEWKYNERGFKLSDGRYYYPDFFIYKDDSFEKLIEVKGYFRESNKQKFQMFVDEYPDIEIELWQRDKLVLLDIINSSGYIK